MLISDYWFHAVLIQQSSGRERKNLEKSKNAVKIVYNSLCVYVCVEYICVS